MQELINELFTLTQEQIDEVIKFIKKIKNENKKRTKDQNALLWEMIGKISKKIGISKEDVYKSAIKDVGQYEIIPLRDDAVEIFRTAWSSKGVGWVTQILGESKFRGYTNIIAYYGTSCYTKENMIKFTEYIINECEQLGIPTEKDDKYV